jgi:hypothetical protein
MILVSQRVFETTSIDLGSYLAAAGAPPTIERVIGGNRAMFTFTETPELLASIVEYERGGSLPAKRLLNVRSWLYREASTVVKGGRS